MNETLGETFDRLSVPSFIRPALTEAIEDHVAARLASVEAVADEWEAEGESLIKHAHSGRDVHEGSTMVSLADLLRGVLGSDAHTEQKGTGE